MEKKLGKIESVSFGLGGYQGAMLGLHVTLGNGSWGVGDTRANWDAEQIKWSEHTKWTEEDRDGWYAEIMRYVSSLLKDAKVDSVDKLIPSVSNVSCMACLMLSACQSWMLLKHF